MDASSQELISMGPLRSESEARQACERLSAALATARLRHACFALEQAMSIAPKVEVARAGASARGAIWVELGWKSPNDKLYGELLGQAEKLRQAVEDALRGVVLPKPGEPIILRQGSAFEDAGRALMGDQGFRLWMSQQEAEKIAQACAFGGASGPSLRL